MDGRSSRHDERRREVLAAAVDHVSKVGLSELSVRSMAEALGLSHGSLLHHFGSKEEMLTRVLTEVGWRQLRFVADLVEREHLDAVALLDLLWQRYSGESYLHEFSVFNEMIAFAIRDRARYPEFLGELMQEWLRVLAPPLHAAGIAPSKVPLLGSVMVSAVRGLLIDLLSTGDRARVEQAYVLLREMFRNQLDGLRTRPVPAPLKSGC